MSRTDQDERVAQQARQQIAFNAGADAFRAGTPRDVRPIPKDHEFWDRGWRHAQETGRARKS